MALERAVPDFSSLGSTVEIMDIALLTTILDFVAALAALAAAVLWLRASGRTVRRVSRFERLDACYLNRMVVAINRAQILNARAAIATAVAAFLAAVSFLLNQVQAG